MKIFVLLSRFPYPLEKGDKLRAYHQLKELSKSNQIHLCCLSDKKIKKEWLSELSSFCETVEVFNLNKALIYWNTTKQLFSDMPFQVGYFYQKRIQRKINQLIKLYEVDHIYCQLIRTAEYVKNIHSIDKTIDYMDALSMGMIRRAEIAGGAKKKLYKSEGNRLAAYENRIFDYFNHHIIISEQDRELINHPDNSKIHVIENGISEEYFNHNATANKKFELVFTGNMNYPPNIECSEYIVNSIMPLLPKNYRLLLSGASPHQRVTNLKKEDKIVVSGWVNDIRDSYASAQIFIAPLFIGTGLQNKLLEAMAMGIPCVTTSLANNALNAIDKEQILTAETAEEFSNLIIQLLEDKDLYKRISEEGNKFVKDQFSWSKSVEKLNSVFNS
jgi:sugar transferase (PEP-CTERM/EpsH1 system associated)